MKTNNFKGKSKYSCLRCGMSNTALKNRGLNFNLHKGQLYCETHFLELMKIKK